MRLADAKRSRFDTDDELKGYEAERRMDHLLSKRPGLVYSWNNRTSQSFMVDFSLFHPKCCIEVEYKDAEHEEVAFGLGFDFLAPKCHQYIQWDVPVDYCLVLSHFKYCVYGSIARIMLYGRPIYKYTERGDWEWFYRVDSERLQLVTI